MIGQYEVQTPEGKIKRRYIRGKSRRELASKLAKAIADRERRLEFDCGSMTVGEILDEWLYSIRASLRSGALRRYKNQPAYT